VKKLFRRWLWDQWQTIHDDALAESRERRAATPAPASKKKGGAAQVAPAAQVHYPLDWRPIVVLVVTALSLTMQEYVGDRDTFARWFPANPNVSWIKSNHDLMSFAWWSGWRFIGYVIVPSIVILLMPGERFRDYGFSVKGFSKHVWIYVALYLAVLPLVVFVSFTHPFQQTYPFYKLANRSHGDFVAWELMYALQFLSLEFFFRGFLLHGLKRAIGAHAIWVMVVPYCMIHFGKPVAETLGAIFAGLILGTLALRTRSIWCGVLIHISVAVTMDMLAMGHCPTDRPCLSHGQTVIELPRYSR
jgi:membrane protease YdiL (CAAX protease family)